MTFTKQELVDKLKELNVYIKPNDDSKSFLVIDRESHYAWLKVNVQQDGSMTVSPADDVVEMTPKLLNRYFEVLQLVNKYVQAHLDPFKAAHDEFMDTWKNSNVANGYVIETNYDPFLIGYEIEDGKRTSMCAVNLDTGRVIYDDPLARDNKLTSVAEAIWDTYSSQDAPLKIDEVLSTIEDLVEDY